jgi:hypothetical protein
MVAATAMALSAGISALGGLTKSIMGAKRAADARRALDRYQRQELKNITEGMRVSTLGAELQTQEAQRRFATSVDALRAGGIRGVVGGLGQQEQQQQMLQQQISADLDKQQAQIEMMRAEDEARIRAIQEQRQTQEIAGLGTEMAIGREQVASGIGDIASVGMNAMAMAAGAPPTGSTTPPKLNTFNSANYNGFKLPQASSFIGYNPLYKNPLTK